MDPNRKRLPVFLPPVVAEHTATSLHVEDGDRLAEPTTVFDKGSIALLCTQGTPGHIMFHSEYLH